MNEMSFSSPASPAATHTHTHNWRSHERFLELLCPLVVTLCVRIHTGVDPHWTHSDQPQPALCATTLSEHGRRGFVHLHKILHRQLCNVQSSDSKRNNLLEISALYEVLQADFNIYKATKTLAGLSALTHTLVTCGGFMLREEEAYLDWLQKLFDLPLLWFVIEQLYI